MSEGRRVVAFCWKNNSDRRSAGVTRDCLGDSVGREAAARCEVMVILSILVLANRSSEVELWRGGGGGGGGGVWARPWAVRRRQAVVTAVAHGALAPARVFGTALCTRPLVCTALALKEFEGI
jgi:hypothetical protein